MDRRDGVNLALLAAAALAPHLGTLLGARVYFSNDLTHISFPWRALTAEQLQRGVAPLWNPYVYFGMPLLGNMQTGALHPPSLLFHVFSFSTAHVWFLALNSVLAGAWTYLWLRRLGAGRPGCLAGSACLALGGYMASHLQFPNLAATLANLPALLLFWGRLLPFALAAAWGLVAGYPPIGLQTLALAAFLSWLWPRGLGARGLALETLRSALGFALGLCLAAPVLGPGLELAARTQRGRGLDLEERLGYSLKASELAGIVHAELARRLAFLLEAPNPQKEEVVWRDGGLERRFTFYSDHQEQLRDPAGIRYTPWKSFYLGLGGCLLALAGAASLARSHPLRAAALAAAAAFAAVLLLGNNWAPSEWLWARLPPLRFVRGPARLSYVLVALALPLAAWGGTLAARRSRGLGAFCALAVVAELCGSSLGFYPTLPRDYYEERGPLARHLQESLGGDRYLQVPTLEVWAYVDKDDPSPEYRRFREMVWRSYKQKLFGEVNAVYHLRAGSGGGYEPLLPRRAGRVAAYLAKRKGGAAEQLKWAGVRYLLDREPIRAPGLTERGERFWKIHEAPGAFQALWLPAQAEAALREPFSRAPPRLPDGARAWRVTRSAEDRLTLSGEAPADGLLYVAEPIYPGWRLYVDGRRERPRQALGAFQYCRVPKGTVGASLVYRPTSWLAGVLAAVAGLACAAGLGAAAIKEAA